MELFENLALGFSVAFTFQNLIYALLGSSRVLNVSSTTTLAILAGTQLGLAVPDGDPTRLLTASATLAALTGAKPPLACNAPCRAGSAAKPRPIRGRRSPPRRASDWPGSSTRP